MIDLLAPSSEGSLHLTRLAIKRDGTSANALLAEIDLATPIETEEDALVLDALVPGASALWRRSSEGAEDTARFGRSPSSMSVHGRLALTDRAEEVVAFARTVTITRAVVAVSAKSRTFIARVRVGGLAAEEVATLCGALDERVHLSTSALQLTLFGGTVSVPVRRDVREVISLRVEVGGVTEYRFGAVTNETDLAISLRDLYEETPEDYDLASCEVVSRLRVAASDRLLSAFRERATSIGLVPSWGDLIVALGRDYGAGAASDAGVWTLRPDHLRTALGGIVIPDLDDEEPEA